MEAHHTMDSLKKAMPVRVQITAILRKALFSGEYKSGDELSLTETAERLGVSRIDEKYITDHYEMRILLESEAAKRAAQRGMPDAADYIKKLEALQSHMDSVSTEEYEELNLAVHSAIWTAADNERLYKFLSSLWNGPSVGIASPKLDHYIKSTQEHIDILKAIQKQDARAAQKEMAKHIERSLNNILKNFKFRT